jgi:hypothetical protein
VSHPHQTLGFPALGLEAGSQRFGGTDEIEVDAPVLEPGERLIGEVRQFLDAHRRVLLDPDDVEGPVARATRRSHDRSVRPRLEHVTDRGMRRIAPGSRAGRRVVVGKTGRSHLVRVRKRIPRASPSREKR